MKKVLVTGAAGFIGSHVVEELLREDVEVRALVKPGEDVRNISNLDIEILEGDVLDRSAMDQATKGIDTVFHLAAIYAIWMQDWSRIYEVNIQGSRNILWSALKSGVERIVYTSSIAALGVQKGMAISKEDTPFNQYTLCNHYVLTKYLSQQLALGFAENGLDLVVVNPCFPFGTNDITPTPTGQMIVDILKGKNQFYFDGGINIVDVRDVARGHVLAAKKGRTGEKYVLGNLNVTMKELMELVYKIAGLEGRRVLFKVPKSILKLTSYFLTFLSDHVTHRPPLSSPADIAYVSQYLYFDNTKARTELGLEFRPIEDSLREAIDWFREKGYA